MPSTAVLDARRQLPTARDDSAKGEILPLSEQIKVLDELLSLIDKIRRVRAAREIEAKGQVEEDPATPAGS